MFFRATREVIEKVVNLRNNEGGFRFMRASKAIGDTDFMRGCPEVLRRVTNVNFLQPTIRGGKKHFLGITIKPKISTFRKTSKYAIKIFFYNSKEVDEKMFN